MEKQTDALGLLDLMLCPGFCAKDNRIIKVNPAAQALFIGEGDDLTTLLLTGQDLYSSFSQGCLFLTVSIQGHPRGASVSRIGDVDIFLLESDTESRELQTLALASRELRRPMGSIMAAVAALDAEDETVQQLNRSLHQLLRILGNMSDAGHNVAVSRPETRNITADIREILEKARTLLHSADLHFHYHLTEEDIYCLTDREQLERALLNMISNAAKFSPKGASIEAALSRKGKMLQLSITDEGSGIAENILGSIFQRYQRQPAIEDIRFGIGLGMTMIHSAAAHHGGAVLVDQPREKGTRVTMTLAIRTGSSGILRSPMLQVDYTGGFDHAMVELSDCLPPEIY